MMETWLLIAALMVPLPQPAVGFENIKEMRVLAVAPTEQGCYEAAVDKIELAKVHKYPFLFECVLLPQQPKKTLIINNNKGDL